MLYKKYFYPFPTLSTERLILRQLSKSDAPSLFKYCSSPTSAKFGAWRLHESVEETKSYIKWLLKSAKQGEYFTWGIVLKENGQLIGTCSYSEVDPVFKVAEIGYGIQKAYQGNGYAKEAVGKIVEYGFCTVGFQKMYARIMKENERSQNLVEKLRFGKEGFIKKGVYAHGKAKDIYIYGITDDEYQDFIKE